MTYKNWKQSMDKWDKIVRYIEEGKTHLVRYDRAMGSMGYCDNSNLGTCLTCKLFIHNLCSFQYRPEVIFWKFMRSVWTISGIRRTDPDWKQALIYAKEIRDFIKEDEPEGK